MTILLTGATGFLGSYLLKAFLTNSHKVIALKRSTSDTYRIDDIKGQIVFYDIDKVELSEVFKNEKIDIVINTVTDYGRKNKKIASMVETNLNFGLKLLEESVEAKVKSFINTDTLLERDINPYALSKSQLVDWMKFISKTEDIQMINIKIEHMYGLLDDENKFIYWLINQLKKDVEEINLTSGIQKRDFIYIEDVVSAYVCIINNLEFLSGYEEFELGSGNSIEVKKFIEIIYRELSKKQKFTTKLNFGAISYRENENMNMKTNVKKLEQLGWSGKISVEDGIKKIVEEEN